jgi:hypothetical protein
MTMVVTTATFIHKCLDAQPQPEPEPQPQAHDEVDVV